MATITTDTYLDGGTARTAGETWTINGCTLTVRTDTRWHADAPASMTGTLGTLTTSTSLGGAIKIDATAVRWMPYDTGTGNVPAIGTSITQGGVSGYLLGVWADYTSAPTAVGAAMPASGFLKFREVTSGPFSTGALTGIGANASSADVTGWIEVCKDASSNFVTNILGSGLVTVGNWFYLDNTNGSRGQQISTPTNGGGSATHIFGVQIETSPGSDVYDWYPACHVSSGAANWSTTNLTTDARAKFVESVGNGVVRIGSDGTNNIGYLPASGCKVRIPNILGRTVATASRASNQVPGAVTRAGINGGNYNVEYLHGDFQYSTIFATPNFILKHSVIEANIQIQDNIQPVVIDNCCIGGFTGGTSVKLQMNRIVNSTFSNTKIVGTGTIGGALQGISIDACTFSDMDAVAFKVRTGSVFGLSFTAMSNCTLTDSKLANGGMSLAQCSNVSITNTDYIDRLEGNTSASNPLQVISMTTCSNVVIDNITFGFGALLTLVNCYSSIITLGTVNSNIKIRNIGSRTAPLDCGSNATFYPSSIINITTSDSNIKLQRCYASGLRSTVVTGHSTNASPNLLVEDCFGLYSTGFTPGGHNATFRKLGQAVNTTALSSNSGTHWGDFFTSDTAGAIKWYAAPPSTETADKNYLVVTTNQGTGYITTGGTISLDTQNDYAFSESNWMFLGHTSFQNATPVITGTATGITVYYDLDTGSGFSGSWTQATGANLSAETISAAGFKMRIKVLQTGTSNTTTAVNQVTFLTNSTVAAQTDNLYPLDTNTLAFTGLATGSEVRCYAGTDPATAIEISGTESTAGSTFSFTHSSGGVDGYIVILAMGYQPIHIDYTFLASDQSILIQPVVDRNYLNP